MAGFSMRRQNCIPILCKNKWDDTTALTVIYALVNRIRLLSSPADAVARIIVDAYLVPKITMEEIRANWIDRHVDPLRDLSDAARHELQTLGRY
jgi:hypothetical protein